MFYENTAKQLDKKPIPRKRYHFAEEDDPPHDLPTTFGKILTLTDLFDMLINEMRCSLRDEHMDPMEIPDGVHKSLNALVMEATLDVDRISVHNLSNWVRKTPILTDYVERVLTISIPISFIDVKVFTDYKINAGPVVISEGRIMGRAGDISLVLAFAIDFKTKQVELKEFDIPTCDLSVVFKGEGLSKYLLNVLTPIIIMLFKAILLPAVKAIIRKSIRDNMNTLNRIIREVEAEKQKQNEQKEQREHATTSDS